MSGLHIQSVGAFAATGGNAPAVMGAVLTGFQLADDLDMEGPDGQPLGGAVTPLPRSLAGIDRLSALGFLALSECAQGAERPAPLILISPSAGEMDADPERLLDAIIRSDAALPVDPSASKVIPRGREAITEALALVDQLLKQGSWESCYLVGVDSLIANKRLEALMRRDAVIYTGRPDGFIPGEAAAAVRFSLRSEPSTMAIIGGIATSTEPAGDDGRAFPLLGIGLATATERALSEARRLRPIEKLSAIATDRMEQIRLEELALARLRSPLAGIEDRALYSAVQSTGEVGAAAGVLGIAALAFFMEKKLIEGGAACLFTGDKGWRGAAVILSARRQKARG